ncbi:protocatechuate 4,5-dioxygenase subunit alpha [Comamonas composti]|uniref:protocatechuate 4,5-dioxygenase subunit alpha n=1 Tax=Comamonas composti TaxID=408558 RepID=UPI00041EA37C|nr:protocatechuate 4,5-dioxygenase subunit alpha [Comamonas composti]
MSMSSLMATRAGLADIPGTYVFDGEQHRLGLRLNLFCKSLDDSRNRERFRQNPQQYLGSHALSAEQLAAVRSRDWLAMLRLGGNIYYLFKLAIFDGWSMQHAGAAMSGTGMSVDEFRQMMLGGGRSIEGWRSRREAAHG